MCAVPSPPVPIKPRLSNRRSAQDGTNLQPSTHGLEPIETQLPEVFQLSHMSLPMIMTKSLFTLSRININTLDTNMSASIVFPRQEDLASHHFSTSTQESKMLIPILSPPSSLEIPSKFHQFSKLLEMTRNTRSSSHKDLGLILMTTPVLFKLMTLMDQ
jgi:hypothetical protein